MSQSQQFDLDINLILSQKVNLSAVERRCDSIIKRRSVKKKSQVEWLLNTIEFMDLTTLAGDDTPGRVSRLCHKALNPVRKDILEELDVSKNVSEYVSNLIPGNGHTEVSIDLRENNKPDYSILGVREILELDSGNIFTQFSLFNTEQNNSERIIGNLGIGSRKLLNSDTLMIGMNAFIDQDFNESHKRGSFGFEVRNSVLDFNGNMYRSLQDTTKEIILDGWDYRLAGQVPYVHWSKLFINGYEWDGVLREDIKGMKIGSEMVLTPISCLLYTSDAADE